MRHKPISTALIVTFGIILLVSSVFASIAVFYPEALSVVQNTGLGGGITTKDYHFQLVETTNADGDTVRNPSPPLSSCGFKFQPQYMSASKECLASMPNIIQQSSVCYGEQCPTENGVATTEKITPAYIIDTKNSASAITNVEYLPNKSILITYSDQATKILKDSVKKTTYSTSFTPRYDSSKNPDCWSVQTNLFKDPFKIGETKVLNDCISIQLLSGYTAMKGTIITESSSEWRVSINSGCFFTEQTVPEHQIEFNKSYTAQIAVDNFLGYDFCGGLEGKITEIGFFTGTQFEIPLKQVNTWKQGCTILPIEVPTNQLKKVEVQFQPLIRWDDNSAPTLGSYFRWTYTRLYPADISEDKAFLVFRCTNSINLSKMPVGMPTTPIEKVIEHPTESNINWTFIIPIAAIILAVVGIAIVLILRKK